MDREFKGVWISKEIWLDDRLNALDKIILAEIDSLDVEEAGCFASNKYLADFCQCSERKITEAISKLIDLGFIYLKSFDGRTRVLGSCLAKFARQTSEKIKAEAQKMRHININNNKEDKRNKKESMLTRNYTDDELKALFDNLDDIEV